MGLFTLNRSILYGLGPFFCHPLKPLLCSLFGDGYQSGYIHFRRDHSKADNLVLHVVCLVFQLLSNFALLGKLDDIFISQYSSDAASDNLILGRFIPIGVGCTKVNLSTTTAACWIFFLSFSGAPRLCTTLSSVSIISALLIISTQENYEHVQWLISNIQAVAVVTFLLVMFIMSGLSKLALKSAAVWIVWLFLWEYLGRFGGENLIDFAYTSLVYRVLVVVLMVIPALLNNPVAPVVLVGALSLNAFSILCEGDHSILSLWAMAYVAMLLQNTAHDVSSQRATLRKLQVDASGDEKTRFEWSHVTYFPDLLFHSCYQSVSGNFNAADVPSALKKESKDE